MGNTRNPSALSLEERNFVEVGTFQLSFGFKDFHHAARLHPPRRWSPKTVTTSPWMGRSKPGHGPRPSLSFKDAYHPCGGGERGEPGLYLRTGRLATSSSSFWWWKPSSSSAEEASSSHAGEGELLLPS
jgi:hypothetical protein